MSDTGQTGESNRQSRFRIVRAVTPEERATVLALRYEMFVHEVGYVIPGTAPEQGVVEPGDDRALILLAYDGATVAGTITVSGWGDDLPASEISNFHLDDFAKAFDRDSVFLIRKAAIVPRYRKSSLFTMLVSQVAEYVYGQPEARFAFVKANPYLVTLYERLGFRRYAPHFIEKHGEAIAVPLCLVADDHEHLAHVRSPILAIARAAGRAERPATRRFFQERWMGSDGTQSIHGIEGATSDLHDETSSALRSSHAALFANVEQEHVEEFLRECRAVEYRARDVLISADSPDADLYLILRGYVDVTRDVGDRKIAIATCGPGDLLGEMSMLLGERRSGTVTALTDVEAILIPERAFRDVTYNSRIAAQINLNLARILARRLRIAAGFITTPPPLQQQPPRASRRV